MSTAKPEVPMASPSRRVIKAKSPPPTMDLPPKKPAAKDDNIQDAPLTYPLASPSVEREVEQELSEKWRKERYDATAAKQKQQRDKELQHRRQNSSSTPAVVDSNGSRSAPADVPAALSVEPQYPEHKRSGETASDGEPVGKRRRASVDDDTSEEKNIDRVAFARKVVVVTAVLAAAVAVGMAILRRSRRS